MSKALGLVPSPAKRLKKKKDTLSQSIGLLHIEMIMLLNVSLIFINVYMCMSLSVCTHVCVHGYRVQKTFLDFMKLKLQVIQCGWWELQSQRLKAGNTLESWTFLASEDDVFKHSYEGWCHLLSKYTGLELSSNWTEFPALFSCIVPLLINWSINFAFSSKVPGNPRLFLHSFLY